MARLAALFEQNIKLQRPMRLLMGLQPEAWQLLTLMTNLSANVADSS